MDAETLISKVFSKPPIWDKKLKVYSNRKVVGKCWKEISKEMKVADGDLRKKWKYLRDQFSVELGKVTSDDSKGKIHEPKWPYYKSLLFLKDVVKPRLTPNSLKTKNKALSWESNDESVDETQSDDTGDYKHEPVFVSFNENDNEDVNNLEEMNNDTDGSNQDNNVGKRKRSNKYNETLIDIESKKAKCLEEALLKNQTPENEDLLFFRSLLPHVNNIPANMKLRFRNRIQEVVDEFAYHVHHSSSLNP